MAINPSLLIVPYRYKADKLYSQLPESGDGDYTVTRSTTATRVNASGLIESVASGVPRLDYTGGGCPSLLVEPAATNLLLRSEEFDNAAWTKQGSATVSSDTHVSPDGLTTADTLIGGGGSNSTRVEQNLTLTSGVTYTASYFVKGLTSLQGRIGIINPGGSLQFQVLVDNAAGVVTLSGQTSGTAIKITPFVNDWYRAELTFTPTTTGTHRAAFYIDVNGTNLSWIVWGAQLQTGSVATSYIPTVASTLSRNADVVSLSSVSGLIGQTEGTIYAEVDLTNRSATVHVITLSDNSSTNRLRVRRTSDTNISLERNLASESSITINATIPSAGKVKLAFAYSSSENGYVIYVNGTQAAIRTEATPTFTNQLNKVNLGSNFNGTSLFNDRISAAAIYTSRLSNSELQSLTQL